MQTKASITEFSIETLVTRRKALQQLYNAFVQSDATAMSLDYIIVKKAVNAFWTSPKTEQKQLYMYSKTSLYKHILQYIRHGNYEIIF